MKSFNRAPLDLTLARIDATRPPCAGPDREMWTSEIATARAQAARLCGQCPALLACRDAADAAGEKWHVWGGVDRTSFTLEARRKASSAA